MYKAILKIGKDTQVVPIPADQLRPLLKLARSKALNKKATVTLLQKKRNVKEPVIIAKVTAILY